MHCLSQRVVTKLIGLKTYLVVRTRGRNGGLLVARLLKRLNKAFSVMASTVVELTTDGALGVGVVNGLCVLRDPNPVSVTSAPDVVNGTSVLLPLFPRGINGFRLGKSRLTRFNPRNRLFPRPSWVAFSDSRKIMFSVTFYVTYIFIAFFSFLKTSFR